MRIYIVSAVFILLSFQSFSQNNIDYDYAFKMLCVTDLIESHTIVDRDELYCLLNDSLSKVKITVDSNSSFGNYSERVTVYTVWWTASYSLKCLDEKNENHYLSLLIGDYSSAKKYKVAVRKSNSNGWDIYRISGFMNNDFDELISDMELRESRKNLKRRLR